MACILGQDKSTTIPHEFHNGKYAAIRLDQYLRGESKVELL